jgi:hypothetical protein
MGFILAVLGFPLFSVNNRILINLACIYAGHIAINIYIVQYSIIENSPRILLSRYLLALLH